VLIFTDIIGSTPYHIARQALTSVTQHGGVVMSGVSLPMLIKAANYRSLSLRDWVAQVMNCALDWVQAEFTR
jgi:mannose/fructose-specific phosphotransferase system component IIA